VLNALNKNYSEAITIYFKYINLPENKAFSPKPVSNIRIDLSGDGYSLLQLKNSAEEDTVIIDLSTLEFERFAGKNRAQISTSRLLSNLKKDLNNNINITRISRDSIEIFTELGTTQEVLIQPNFSLSLKKGMVLKKPVYSDHERVMVNGPISLVQVTSSISTEHVDLVEISEYAEVEVNLAHNSKLLKPEFTSVKLIVDVEALTEGEIEVPIHIVGLPENKRVRLMPDLVNVKYSTGLSHYDLINPDLFDIIINYEDVQKNASKIPVYLRSVPSYINVIQFYPEQVGYLKMDILD
jgi:YbbR domain-containing protein